MTRHFIAVVVAAFMSVGSVEGQTLTYGDTIVEIVGLETWSVDEVEAAVRRYMPTISLASAACAVILRDSVGFADASVHTRIDPGNEVSVLLRVVEPQKRHLVQYAIGGRDDIPSPESWSDLDVALEADLAAFSYLQFPEFLLTGADTLFDLPVPASALELRQVLRRHNSASDFEIASRIIQESSNMGARQLAALVLSNFASDDRAWHLLVHGIRVMSDSGGAAAQMIFQALARSGQFQIDWTPATADLMALLGGTNLFAYNTLLGGLVETGIDPELARKLAKQNPELLAGSAAADLPAAAIPAVSYLTHAGAPDFGDDYSAWLAWLKP